MKYLADILSLFRLVAAVVVALCVLQGWWLAALLWFVAAMLSDAGDGYAARRWPYEAEDELRLPWRRIDPHMLDNIPDSMLVVLAISALSTKFTYWWWISAVIVGMSLAFLLVIELLVRRGIPKMAERVDVVFGWWFAGSLTAILFELAGRSGYLWLTVVAGMVIAILLVYFKRDRMFTRPETRG